MKVCGEIWCKVGPIFGRRTNKRDCHFMPKLGLIRKFLKKKIQTFQITFFFFWPLLKNWSRKEKAGDEKTVKKIRDVFLIPTRIFFGQNFSDAKIIRGSKMSGKKSGHYWFSCRVVTVWLQGSFWLTKPEGKDPGRDCVDLNFSELATVLVAQCGKSRKMSDLFQKSIWRIFHAIKLRKIIDDFEYWFFGLKLWVW